MNWLEDEVEVPVRVALMMGIPVRAEATSWTEASNLNMEAHGTRLDRNERLRRLNAILDAKGVDTDLKQIIQNGAREGLPKLEDRSARVTRREILGLEAVILTDGTRPSLTVRNGFIETEAPEVGDWLVQLTTFRIGLERVIRSIGRINIPVKPFFVGTAVAIAPNLVMTNRHVAEDLAFEEAPGRWRLNWPDHTTLDFVAEKGRDPEPTSKVTAVAWAGADPINNTVEFGKLDVAILRCEPIGDGVIPVGLPVNGDPEKLHEKRAFCAIGFPGRPWIFHSAGRPPPGFETMEVINQVFAGDFDVKKLAPGRVDAVPGMLEGDSVKKWIVGHDASTLGGNSGSLIVDLDEDGAVPLGIHFGGLSRSCNYGHGLSAIFGSLPELVKRLA